MKKLVLLFCLLPAAVFGQLYTNPFLSRPLPNKPVEQKRGVQQVDLYAGSDIGSNSLNNRLFYNYATKNFITDEVKSSSLILIKDKIRVGWHSNFNGYISWASGKPGLSFFAGLQTRQQFGAKGPGQLYQLILFGNSGFEDESVPLGPTQYIRYYYQNLTAGFVKEGFGQEKNRGWMYGAGISFVKGSGFQDLEIRDGFLYTAPFGDSVAIGAEGTYRFTTPKARIGNTFGFGGAINAFFGIQLNNASSLYASVSDLGLIGWKESNTVENNFNSTYSFTGIEVRTDSEGNIVYSSGINVLDSLTEVVESGRQNKAIVNMLPARFQLIYNLKLDPNWGVVVGSEYFLRSVHRPSVHFSGKYFFTPETAIAGGVQILGYGDYGILLRGEVKVNDQFRFVLGTDHLETIFSLDRTKGNGLFARLTFIPWKRAGE